MSPSREAARLAAAALGLALWAAGAGAVAAAPTAQDICRDGRVDKHLLVDALADASHLRWSFTDALMQAPAAGGPPTWRRLVADPDLCSGSVKCTKADKTALEQIRVQVALLLRNKAQYRPTKAIASPEAFFGDDAAQLECVGAPVDEAQPTHVAAAAPKAVAKLDEGFDLDRFRLRGTAQDLLYSRTTSQFKGLSKTSLNFTDDQIADKQTQRIVGVLGYSLRPDAILNTLIPYVGIDRSVSKTKGKAESVSADTRDYGVLATFFKPVEIDGSSRNPTILGNYLSVAPDYLFDFTDHSAIVSANLLYIPTVNNRLNDYIFVHGADHGVLFSWEPIAELHWDNGWYARRGVVNPATHRDFSRLGGRFGFSIDNENADFPLTLTLTDVQLGGLRGPVGHISYLSSDLSWSLAKYLSLDLTYSDGRREDTAKRERTTGFSLSAKY